MRSVTPTIPGDVVLLDADNHYYETIDSFTRHLPETLQDRGLRIVTGEDGRKAYFFGDTRFTFLREPFPTDRVASPGGLREMLRTLKSGSVTESEATVPMDPAFRDRDARIALMDRQGLAAAMLFPTTAVCVEHCMRDDPELTYTTIRAFNQWLEDDWGYAYQDRIYAVPLLSLIDLDQAIAELDRVLALGARLIHLRPGPQGQRAPGDPYFDPFWSRVNEAGVSLALHISESGYNELFSIRWGELPNPPSHEQSAFQWTNFYGDRPIMDTISSLVFSNFFERFPNIDVLSVENGSLWVPYLMGVMDKMKGMGRNGPWPGGYVKGLPSEILRQRVFVSPFHEEDIVALVGRIGASQVVFGSDFPHPEGLAEPAEFVERLAGLPDADIARIMGGNATHLLGH
jgi:predicted TIM-barrel fold metal-dependent hydrolase